MQRQPRSLLPLLWLLVTSLARRRLGAWTPRPAPPLPEAGSAAPLPVAVRRPTYGGGGGGRVRPSSEPAFWTYFVPNPIIPPRWPASKSDPDPS